MIDAMRNKEKAAVFPRKGATEDDSRINAPRPTTWLTHGHGRVQVPTLDDYDGQRDEGD